MSRDIQNRPSCTSKRRATAARCLLLASLSLNLTSGCGPAEPQEISAATSGYKPSEPDPKSNTKATSTSSTNAGASSTSAEASPLKQTSSEGQPLKEAPAVPTFQPGKLDPAIASKQYMTLKLGDLNGPEQLMEFLDTTLSACHGNVSGRTKKNVDPRRSTRTWHGPLQNET